jgi:hypothetical protein
LRIDATYNSSLLNLEDRCDMFPEISLQFHFPLHTTRHSSTLRIDATCSPKYRFNFISHYIQLVRVLEPRSASTKSLGSAADRVAGYKLNDRRVRVRPLVEARLFFSLRRQFQLGRTQPPIKCISGAYLPW